MDITKYNDNIKNGIFDMIVCTEVIEHTNNPLNAIKELTRLLKEDGILILSTPYNFRMHGPLPDNFRFTEWFYKNILPPNFNILHMKLLEKSTRNLAPINCFTVCRKIQFNKKTCSQKLKGLVFHLVLV